MRSFRPVLLVNGMLLLTLAVTMLVPALLDILNDNPDWQVFVAAAFVTGFAGSGLV